MHLQAAFITFGATVAALFLSGVSWLAAGWLLVGTIFEDVGGIIKIAAVFLTLTVLERVYNAIELRVSSGH